MLGERARDLAHGVDRLLGIASMSEPSSPTGWPIGSLPGSEVVVLVHYPARLVVEPPGATRLIEAPGPVGPIEPPSAVRLVEPPAAAPTTTPADCLHQG